MSLSSIIASEVVYSSWAELLIGSIAESSNNIKTMKKEVILLDLENPILTPLTIIWLIPFIGFGGMPSHLLRIRT
jgi:hypothetical protein